MAESEPQFVLASGSPRRRELLETQGFVFDVRPPDVDETPLPNETPAALVDRLARTKATAIDTALVTVAADTVVSIDGEILGKPVDEEHAAAMLRQLSGRVHLVATGVAVAGETLANFVVTTEVSFICLDDESIERYVASGEPLDKAGAYGIQGAGAAFVTSVAGSYTNVVGLPLAETVAALRIAGVSQP